MPVVGDPFTIGAPAELDVFLLDSFRQRDPEFFFRSQIDQEQPGPRRLIVAPHRLADQNPFPIWRKRDAAQAHRIGLIEQLGVGGADGRRLAGQNHEDRLERVLGQLVIAEGPPADAKYGRAMVDQFGECVFIVRIHESAQAIAVALFAGVQQSIDTD